MPANNWAWINDVGGVDVRIVSDLIAQQVRYALDADCPHVAIPARGKLSELGAEIRETVAAYDQYRTELIKTLRDALVEAESMRPHVIIIQKDGKVEAEHDGQKLSPPEATGKGFVRPTPKAN